jgi:iron complex outermembrane receptor protein
MTRRTLAYCAASASVLAFFAHPAMAQPARAPTGTAQPAAATVQELVVTANKREQNINDVGMSVQAVTGDKLLQLGIYDTSDLQKIVPGFQATPTYYGTYVFTIRGIGFQDTSLAGSPTVSVYVDEFPLPFSVLTYGASLDLDRVEVLKGPQGTLFGMNATGGAINYIARKPTETFEAGVDASVGRFNDVDVTGFVSGPVVDTLQMRAALRINKSDAWQKGYLQQDGRYFGGKEFINGRVSAQWQPTKDFKAILSFNSWLDKGWTQAGRPPGCAASTTIRSTRSRTSNSARPSRTTTPPCPMRRRCHRGRDRSSRLAGSRPIASRRGRTTPTTASDCAWTTACRMT